MDVVVQKTRVAGLQPCQAIVALTRAKHPSGGGGWRAGRFTTLPTHLLLPCFAASNGFILRIIYSGLVSLTLPPANSSVALPPPTPPLYQDLTRGYFNNEDGLTAIESAHKLELQPTSMSNLPSS